MEVFNIKEKKTDGIKIKTYQRWLVASTFVILILITGLIFLPMLKITYFDDSMKNQYEKMSTDNISDSVEKKIIKPLIVKKNISDSKDNIAYNHDIKDNNIADEMRG